MKNLLTLCVAVFLAAACGTPQPMTPEEQEEEAAMISPSPDPKNPVCDAAWCGEWGYCCNSYNTACTRCAVESYAVPVESNPEGVRQEK